MTRSNSHDKANTQDLPELTVLAVRNAEVLCRTLLPGAEAVAEGRRMVRTVYAPDVLRRDSGVYLLLEGRLEVACFDEDGSLRDVWREVSRPLSASDLSTLIADEDYPRPGQARALFCPEAQEEVQNTPTP